MPPAKPGPEGRKRVGKLSPWVLALLAGGLLFGIVAGDRLLLGSSEYKAGESAPYTLRVSPLSTSPLGANGGAIAIARGEVVDAKQAQVQQSQGGLSAGHAAALFCAIFALILGWSRYLRSGHWGSRLRNQLVTLGSIVLIALVLRALFLFTTVSILAAPVALLGILVGRRSSRGSAVASASLLALLVAAMVPFDIGIAAALLLQAAVPPLLLRRNTSAAPVVGALALSGILSALAYALAYAAAWQTLPSLSDPLRSTWLAALLAVAISAALLLVLGPLYAWLCGEVSKRKLSSLERLSQPLLRQISTQAPGTWQHSLAMEKLANGAGLAIGADVQLLRVGAYYHDLGKSVAPKYFIENLGGGDTSVHEKLKPAASRDAIFAHVSEGIRLAKEAGLPTRVIDFIRSHHCAATLEYFWTLEQAQTPASSATLREFSYPGTRPQCRETGILCICDAVEGASRNFKNPSRAEIEALVHHIVYGKLRAGQLDESGLSLSDIQAIDQALSQSLIQAHSHDAPRQGSADATATAVARPQLQDTLEQAAPKLALLSQVRLDSLDLPKRDWQQAEKIVAESPFGADPNMGFVQTEAVEQQAALGESDTQAVDTQDELASTTNYEARKAEALRKSLESRPTNEHTSPASASTDFLRTKERTAQSMPEERITMPQSSQLSGVEERITAPREALDSGAEERVTAPQDTVDEEVEERVTAPRNAAMEDVEDRLTAPREVVGSGKHKPPTLQQPIQYGKDPDTEDTAARVTGPRRSVQPVQGSDESHEEPLLLESPIRGKERDKKQGKEDSLGQWTEALGEAQDPAPEPKKEKPLPPPPPSGGHHVSRETIPLGKDELHLAPAPPSTSRPSRRADSNDGMKPGEMVIGAPPATHPERTLMGIIPREEITAEHHALLPDEARRPEDRITEETPAVMPLDAYPETISAPGPILLKPKSDEES